MDTRTIVSTLTVFTVLLFATTSVQALVVTQTVANQDWNNAIWGSPAAAPTSGNDYVTDSTYNPLRASNSGGASTFGGDNLTIAAGSRLLVKNQGGSSSTVTGDMTVQGALIQYGPTGSTNSGTLAAGSIILSGNNEFVDSGTNFTVYSTLTGSGNLYFGNQTAGTPTNQISISGISGYTGTLTVGDTLGIYGVSRQQNPLTIDFSSLDYHFLDTFTLLNSSILNVNDGQTLTFGRGDLLDGATAIDPGTYTANTLGTSFSGTGTIIVVPEPSTIILAGLGLAGLCLRRRRR